MMKEDETSSPARRRHLKLYVLVVLFATRSLAVTIPARFHDFRHENSNKLQFRGGGSVDVSNKLFRRQLVDENRMPSLFAEGEEVYDRYAACLAATEGLRRIRDRDLAFEVQAQKQGTSAAKSLNEAERQITKKYVQNSGKVLRALGMTVGQFNELGRTIAQDSNLKQKVIEQAYLYRMAATIRMDRTPFIDDAGPSESLRAVPRDKIQLFSESVTEIEQLREEQLRRLTKALHVEKFPDHVNISDPDLLPFLSPRVRAVVEAFPLQAEEIVKRHGLQSDEFNKMLQESRSNAMFRWKVQKQIKAAAGDSGPNRSQGETALSSSQPASATSSEVSP